MTFTVPYPPSLNAYYRTWKGRVLISAEGRAYRTSCQRRLAMLGLKRMEGPVAVRIHVHRPRRVGDLDNTLKCLLDSLNGMAWADDSQVVDLHAIRHDDAANPRVEVEIRPAG